MSKEEQAILHMESVTKRYPGTLAVDSVSLSVKAGEVHALLGENGAGKSTLMKMLAGAFDDYEGQIFIEGKEVKLYSPAAAKGFGIGMVYQELSLAPPISIAENMLAGRLPTKGGGLLDRQALMEEARHCLDMVQLGHLNPAMPVEDISQHEAQLVEIAKVLGSGPSILVLDEPTSSLSATEVQLLFKLMKSLKEQGLAIVYISHHLQEIFEIADRATVMRDGKKIGSFDIADITPESVVEMMVGGSPDNLYGDRNNTLGAEALRVEKGTRYGFFHEIDFSVRAGEIVGIGGLSGAGRSELARSICGIDPFEHGKIFVHGEEEWIENYAEGIRHGLTYLSEDRKQQGLALRLTSGENLLAAIIPKLSNFGLYSGNKGTEPTNRLIEELQVSPPDPEREVANLSGGNQQKVLLAKWLATDPEVIFLDEPTRGVDVGAKAVIHKAVAEVANRGKSVVLISSDLPELVGLSDRVLIMRKGRFIGELSGDQCTEESVLLAANGEGDFS